MRFKPAPPGSGRAFVRTDQPEPVRIAARVENLTKRPGGRRSATAPPPSRRSSTASPRCAGWTSTTSSSSWTTPNCPPPTAARSRSSTAAIRRHRGAGRRGGLLHHRADPRRRRRRRGRRLAGRARQARDHLRAGLRPDTPIGHQIHRFTWRTDFASRSRRPARSCSSKRPGAAGRRPRHAPDLRRHPRHRPTARSRTTTASRTSACGTRSSIWSAT
jgi:hypothetical protein